MADKTNESLSTAERVAEARAIKAERDREALEFKERRQAEEAEIARVRAEKIAAGLLGICPHCKEEVDTAEGIVLSHNDQGDGGHVAARVPTPCRGIGEAAGLTADAVVQAIQVRLTS
jgi:hypothetical protein